MGAAFYDRDPAIVARALLGAVLSVVDGTTVTSGRIIETEAYLGPHDAACHAVAGRTARTWHLFGPPGTSYVYRIYGIHWCMNAVTREDGFGSAVLIRALEPLEGIAAMRERRWRVVDPALPQRAGPQPSIARRHVRGTGAAYDAELCNGPGKLCAAFGIDRRHDGLLLTGGSVITITAGKAIPDTAVLVGPRIGITKDAALPLRFWLRGAKVVRASQGEGLAGG